MPDSLKKRVVRERLADKLSEAQLDIMLSKKPRKLSKKWTNEDYAKSQSLSLLCGKKAYDFVKNEVAPMPAFYTARKKYSHVRVVPNQIIQATLLHLRHLRKSMRKNEHLCIITFDEINLKNVGQYHMKLDKVIGNLQFDAFGTFCEASGSPQACFARQFCFTLDATSSDILYIFGIGMTSRIQNCLR